MTSALPCCEKCQRVFGVTVTRALDGATICSECSPRPMAAREPVSADEARVAARSAPKKVDDDQRFMDAALPWFRFLERTRWGRG